MLLDALEIVTDPRIERTKRYTLKEVLLSAFIAILDGARSWRDIQCSAELNLDKLREFLPFVNGIPSHHTYSRVFQLIEPDSLEMAFRHFAQEIIKALDCDVTIINIDGKQMRGATAAGGNTVHLLSAWCHDAGISMGQLKVNAKTNEITAIPELLDKLHVAGALVTIDAMGTQKEIARKIVKQKAEYLLALKGNQSTLSDEAQQVASNYAPDDAFEAPPESMNGFVFERSAKVFKVTARRFKTAKDWEKIARIVQITCVRTHKKTKQVTIDTRYYITNNKTFSAEQYLTATRKHWGIENGCHWQLDVTFSEDASRKYKGNSAENFSRFLRLCLNTVKSLQFTGCFRNASMRSKCKKVVKSKELLSQVLYGISDAN
ncbi:MAG: ISAs1 family transposase [Anaerobiospirillum sp.]|nr:ISAs1 family transposase [Anaerobiospirillum sp.]